MKTTTVLPVGHESHNDHDDTVLSSLLDTAFLMLTMALWAHWAAGTNGMLVHRLQTCALSVWMVEKEKGKSPVVAVIVFGHEQATLMVCKTSYHGRFRSHFHCCCDSSCFRYSSLCEEGDHYYHYLYR